MPEATDPANARLALRRLVAGLVAKGVDVPHSAKFTTDELLAHLDAEEGADYEQVLAALSAVGPPRFAVLNWNGWALLDLGAATDVHGSGEALVVIAGDEKVVRALAVVLNADPSALDEALDVGPEPF